MCGNRFARCRLRGVRQLILGRAGYLAHKPGTAPACGRSAENYASQVAARMRLALTDVTCANATTANILTSPQARQRPQLSAVTADASLVTITVGGNDVDYLGSLFAYSWQNSGSEKPCSKLDQGAMRRQLQKVGTKIRDVISAVHSRAPKAEALMVDYLTVLPETVPVCAGVPLTPRKPPSSATWPIGSKKQPERPRRQSTRC
ncbi:GDSL-type esterase/lipase family protein [Amycolatopsis sp. NPDC059090]